MKISCRNRVKSHWCHDKETDIYFNITMVVLHNSIAATPKQEQVGEE